MAEKSVPTLAAKLRCLQSLMQQLGANTACEVVSEAIDKLAETHLAQPAQAVDVGALKDPEMVHALMLRGTIAVPTIRSMVHLRGPVHNTEDGQTARIAELQEQVADLTRALGNAQVEGWKAIDGFVRVPVDRLTFAIDLLAERIYGNPARSPAHNARLTLESLLPTPPQPEE